MWIVSISIIFYIHDTPYVNFVGGGGMAYKLWSSDYKKKKKWFGDNINIPNLYKIIDNILINIMTESKYKTITQYHNDTHSLDLCQFQESLFYRVTS